MAKELDFDVMSVKLLSKGFVEYTIHISDEYTLGWMEKHYPKGRLFVISGRVYELRFVVKMSNPDEIKDLPAELTRRFVLERLKGD